MPSSNENAPTMCSRSGSVMKFQNRVAWEKWSSKDWARSRFFMPSTALGTWT